MNTLTKNAIKSSLIDLLEEKSLSKITIQQIVNKCGIGRNTFYYHYQDVFMVIEDILEERKKQLQEDIQSTKIDELSGYIVNFLIENRVLINHVYNSMDIRIIERYIHDVFSDGIDVYIHKYIDLTRCNHEQIAFTIDFISYAYTGMIMNWFSKGMKEEMLLESVNSIRKHLNTELLEKLLYS